MLTKQGKVAVAVVIACLLFTYGCLLWCIYDQNRQIENLDEQLRTLEQDHRQLQIQYENCRRRYVNRY